MSAQPELSNVHSSVVKMDAPVDERDEEHARSLMRSFQTGCPNGVPKRSPGERMEMNSDWKTLFP